MPYQLNTFHPNNLQIKIYLPIVKVCTYVNTIIYKISIFTATKRLKEKQEDPKEKKRFEREQSFKIN